MHFFRLASLTFALTINGMSGHSATTDGQFAARGAGALACADLVAMLDQPDRQVPTDQFAAWIAGYLSHANRATEGSFDVMAIQDNYGLAALAENICRTNPTVLVETVMATMLKQMSAGAATAPSDIVQVGEGEQRALLRAETLIGVQTRLVADGLLTPEAADGKFGPMTRDALKSFQKARGIGETGLPDVFTLYLMFGK
jgi:hypothetical protein